MRPTVNFVVSAEGVRKAVFYFMSAFIAVVVLAVIFMIVDAGNMRIKTPVLTGRLTAIKAEYDSLPKIQDMPSAEKIASIRRKVALINALNIGRSSGVTELLFEMEKLTPQEIGFTSFQYSLEDRSLQVGARAKKQETIPVFIEALEKSPFYSGVRLEKQSQKESAGGGMLTDFILKFSEEQQ